VSSPVKIGIAGCGPGGTQVMYAPILRYLETGVVTALMDPSPDALDYMTTYCPEAQQFSDYDTFLAEADMDAVLIGSPVFMHKEQTIKAAKAGKHVLSEKPMARTVAECDAMIDACEKAGVVLMVAFMKRFDKSFRLAKQMVDAGELGEVFQIHTEWSWPGAHPGSHGWRVKLPTWGGIFQDHGSHTIDLCRWWVGDVETVSGEIRIINRGREVEDTAIAILRHTNGALSLHHQTAATHKPLIEYYQLDGTKATLEIKMGPAWSYISTAPFTMTLYEHGKTQKDLTLYNKPNIDDEKRAYARYLKELEHFCDCVTTGAKPATPPENGRATIMAISAVYASSWTGRKIHLPYTEEPDYESNFRAMWPQ